MQTLSFQQNTGFNPGALIKRNQAKVADHDGIRSPFAPGPLLKVRMLFRHTSSMSGQQGGEEIEFPADISRARQKLFRYRITRSILKSIARMCVF